MKNWPLLLLAEVESSFGLEYLRGVGLLGLRGGDTWSETDGSSERQHSEQKNVL